MYDLTTAAGRRRSSERRQAERYAEYRTIEDARMALQEVEMDVRADAGEDMVEAGWRDIVHVVAERCTPEVANELLRREGFDPLW